MQKETVSGGRAFVFVPGGFHGGWCFARVAELLRAQGHSAFTPTLTGLGERSHLMHARIDCSLHIQDVINVLRWERLEQAVLCGHSYGGMIITGVADAMPDRVASLVYLDAALPENGRSTLDLVSDADRRALEEAIVRTKEGVEVLLPFPASAFNVNAADREMVDSLLTPHPFATLREPLHLTGAWERVRRKTYVRATRWGGTNPEQSYARVRSDPTWSTVEVPCGHDVMLDEPTRLAEILLEAM